MVLILTLELCKKYLEKWIFLVFSIIFYLITINKKEKHAIMCLEFSRHAPRGKFKIFSHGLHELILLNIDAGKLVILAI